MNKIQKLIAIATATCAAIIPFDIAKADVNQQRAIEDIKAELIRLNINVTTQPFCEVNGHQAYGVYNARTNEMCISRNVPAALQLDALTHESVHVVQDCIAGLGNNRLETFLSYFKKENERSVVEHLLKIVNGHLEENEQLSAFLSENMPDKHTFSLEAEAYTFEKEPAAVAEMLKNCR